MFKPNFSNETIPAISHSIEFLEETKAFKSPATYRQYSQALDRYNRYLPISEISSLSVVQYTNSMKEEGLSIAAINCNLRGIRVYINWLKEKGYNEGFKVNMVKGQEEEFKCYTDVEIKKLLARPTRKDYYTTWRQWAITNWVLATGNRASTIRNIKIKDIDFINQEIHLNKTKNRRFQVIPLSPSLSAVLVEFLRVWRFAADPDEYLFCDSNNNQMTANALVHSTYKYNKSRGVDNTSLHSLRHTFAREYLKNGGNVFLLQRILGHQQLEMTRRYCNIVCEDLKAGFDIYSPLDKIKRERA